MVDQSMIREAVKNMKVGKKLLISYAIILALYVFSIGVALFGIGNVAGTLNTFYNRPFQVVSAAGNMRAAIQGVGRAFLSAATTDNESSRERYIGEAKTLIATVDLQMPVLEKHFENQVLVRQLKENGELLKPQREAVLSLLEQGEYDAAAKAYREQYEPLASEARECLTQIGEEAAQNADEYLADGFRVRNSMIAVVLGLGAAVILISGSLWLIFTRSIAGPVKETSDAARELSEGNLNVEINYRSNDELGELSESMRQTASTLRLYLNEIEETMHAIGTGKLNYRSKIQFKGDFVSIKDATDQITKLLGGAITQIGTTADQVAGGADQVADGAQVLSQGAVEQAGSMEELAANINEISDSVKNNADDAVGASRLVDSVNTMVAASSTQMEEMVLAIRNISENSRKVTGIVKEIEDIAFQTNLLALNASVEAARAGEAGRGFSVVANEIRHLSSKTTEASKMMADLASENTDKVEKGTQAVKKSSQALEKVIEGTAQVIGMVDRISDASVKQADSIIQIRQSIEQISEIVQGNSATSEESAAASEELSAQAQILKKLVEEFEIE